MEELWARLVQLHEQLHEQLHNFNSQTANSLPNSLVSFSENSLSHRDGNGYPKPEYPMGFTG
jgi:hypothetical protein